MQKPEIILLPNHGIVRGKITAKLFSAFMKLPGHSKWKDGEFYFAHSKANLEIILEAAGDDVILRDEAQRLQQLKEAHGHRVGKTDLKPRGTIELKSEPWDHQKRAVAWGIERAFGMYRMGVGTGKSYTILLHGSHLFCENALDRMLIVTQPIVIEEFLTDHLPNKMPKGIRWSAHMIDSSKKPSWVKADPSRLHLAFCTPQMFTSKKGIKLIENFVKGGRCGVFVDEAHDFSNDKAKRTKALDDILAHAVFKFELTGTLTPKGLENLYSQYKLLHPDIIGHASFTSFKNQYCVMGGFEGREIVGYREQEKLMAAIAPHTFYVDIADCFDMPSQTWRTEGYYLQKDHLEMFMELKTKFTTMLTEAKRELEERIAELKAAGWDAAESSAAARKAMNFSRVVNSAMSQHVAMRGIMHGYFRPNPILDEDGDPIVEQPPPIFLHNDRVDPILTRMLDDKRPIFIWGAYRDDVFHIEKAFRDAGHEVGIVLGGMPAKAKHAVIEAGRRNELRAIIGTVGAGGTGVNGQFATHSVFFSNNYSYGKREQTEGRTWRAGQEHPCVYTDLVCKSAVARVIDSGYRNNLQKKKGIDLSLRGFLKMASALEHDKSEEMEED